MHQIARPSSSFWSWLFTTEQLHRRSLSRQPSPLRFAVQVKPNDRQEKG